MTRELRALTGVRGIAAWMVVLYHIRFAVAGLPPRWIAVFSKGYLAVDFFFLLSGFVIYLSWGERLRREGWRGVPGFLRRRVARVWPLHLVMLAGAGALVAMLAATGRAVPPGFPLAELPLHVVLVQNWGFTDWPTWNVPAWSISCEFAAYLAFPLFAMLADWHARPTWLVAAAGCAALLLLAAITAREPSLGTDIARFGLVRCLAEFAAGTTICVLWQRWRSATRGPAIAAVAVAVAAAWLFAWAMGCPEQLAVPFALAAALLALALTSSAPRNPLSAAPLHWLGEISYATYLSHYLLFTAFKLVFVSDARAIPPWGIALYLALVLTMSVALYHLVERPAQRWLNGASMRRAGRPHLRTG